MEVFPEGPVGFQWISVTLAQVQERWAQQLIVVPKIPRTGYATQGSTQTFLVGNNTQLQLGASSLYRDATHIQHLNFQCKTCSFPEQRNTHNFCFSSLKVIYLNLLKISMAWPLYLAGFEKPLTCKHFVLFNGFRDNFAFISLFFSLKDSQWLDIFLCMPATSSSALGKVEQSSFCTRINILSLTPCQGHLRETLGWWAGHFAVGSHLERGKAWIHLVVFKYTLSQGQAQISLCL